MGRTTCPFVETFVSMVRQSYLNLLLPTTFALGRSQANTPLAPANRSSFVSIDSRGRIQLRGSWIFPHHPKPQICHSDQRDGAFGRPGVAVRFSIARFVCDESLCNFGFQVHSFGGGDSMEKTGGALGTILRRAARPHAFLKRRRWQPRIGACRISCECKCLSRAQRC